MKNVMADSGNGRLERGMRDENKVEKVNASESVYGFVAWLTCRTKPITLSSKDDCSEIARLVKDWCDTNELPGVREERYPGNIIHPVEHD